jgi:hypothetical protein
MSGLSRARSSEISDPFDVLNGIIGRKIPEKSIGAPSEKPAHLVETINFEGLSLDEFVAQGKESTGIFNSEVGAQTIQQCMFSKLPWRAKLTLCS